jgi:DNA-directed RNA polymerase subunit RPC12/RpoP
MPGLLKHVDGAPYLPHQVREVLRVCWSCGATHALRYQSQPEPPRLSRDYACPYCRARNEELCDGELEVRYVGFPRGRRTRG